MPLLLLEALAVGALVHGGVGLVRADLDGVQTAVPVSYTHLDVYKRQKRRRRSPTA